MRLAGERAGRAAGEPRSAEGGVRGRETAPCPAPRGAQACPGRAEPDEGHAFRAGPEPGRDHCPAAGSDRYAGSGEGADAKRAHHARPGPGEHDRPAED